MKGSAPSLGGNIDIGADLGIGQAPRMTMAGISPAEAMARMKGAPDLSFRPTGISDSLERKAMVDINTKAIKDQMDVSLQKQKDVATADTKRAIYKEDLDTFLSIDNVLHEARGKGLGRFDAGLGMKWEGIKQDSNLGRAVATHDAARKRLRVQLVRAAGDVGNINIVEQKAAEQMIPTEFDDYETAELKRAYLKDIGSAINSGDGKEVKSIVNKWMKKMEKTNPEAVKDLEYNAYLEAIGQ
jgi:hypothetical protein